MRIPAFAVLALLAACAPSQAPEPSANAPAADANNGALPAPTPQDVAVRINAAQDGQSVEVGVNQRFAVELVGVPTAGYVWAPAQMPAFLTRAGEATGPTIAAQNQPGYTGGSHWEVLMFAATQPGSGELVIEQRRPWESNEPPAHTFRVTIVAR
jgi:predicted secreted protein